MSKEYDKMSHKITFDIYVGHLPKNIEEIRLMHEFAKYGEVVDILCRYAKGTYGYAIVKYKYKKDAEKLLSEVNIISIDGCDMEIRCAKRNNQSVENGNGPAHGKSVTFMDPPYVMRGMSYINPPVPPPEKYMPHLPYENSAQQLPVMIEVLCSSVENAVTFYGCPIFRCEELQNLSLKLNSICPNLMRLLKRPVQDKIYGAKFSEDKQWYRCSVIQSTIPPNPGMCVVQYIDYGNIDHVSYTNMVDLPEPIKRIPSFAVKCILSNLMCNTKAHCDISYLHHLVNQRMSLCALSVWGVPQYNVLKCFCNGIDVVSELVRNGFAIYKSQKNYLSSSVTSKSERSLRAQENKQPEKPNSAHLRKSNGTCNHVDIQLPNEVDYNKESGRMNQAGASHSFPSEVSHDFAPKKIIKRGSDITDVSSFPVSDTTNVKQTVNQFMKIDCVISNMKLVNSVRDLVSLTSDDNLINSAVDLLLNEAELKTSGDLVNELKEVYREYNNVLNEIKSCTDQQLLDELKRKRELQKSDLCTQLKNFLENFDTSVLEKRKTIQTMITDLESNSNAWMNVYLPTQPATVEDLLAEYNKEKENKRSIIQKVRQTTNEKHMKHMEFLADLQKEFSLNIMEHNADFSYHLAHTEGKKGSWALKFEETLSDLGNALENEIKTCSVSKDKNCISVIQCILDKLDIPKEKVDAECEIYEKYRSLYDDLQNMTDLRCVFETLAAVKEEIKNLCGLIPFKNDLEKEQDSNLSKLYSELHNALSKEDYLIETLSKASALHFPELVLEHPELNLSDYQNNGYLMKHSWRIKYFPVTEPCSRVETSYASKFVNEHVVIKEFKFDNKSEKISFMKKAVVWNEIKSKSLVKIKALFKKDDTTVCAMLTSSYPNLLENPCPGPVERKTACHLLQQILIGLKDIHSRGMAHGAVHPLSILHNEKEIVLDFNYDLRFILDKIHIKGINFKVPSGEDMCKSADMYGFGCLVLWILFPNLSFTSTKEGVPNLSAFQSILEDLLSAKDFSSLSALLSSNPDFRPSSRRLLSCGFLKDLRIVSETEL